MSRDEGALGKPPPPPTSPSRVRRSSLTLSPSWSQRNLDIPPIPGCDSDSDDCEPRPIKDDDDEDDDDLVQLAFFPVLESMLQKVAEVDLDGKSTSISSDVSVTGSIFSAGDIWQDVPMGPPDAILGIAQAYNACTDPQKVNVCVGAYRDEQGKPWVLPTVREAERRLLAQNENKEYLPIEGDKDFIVAAMKFAYGPEMDLNHVAAVQTLSGTGACRIGGCFLAQFWPKAPIYVPDPTWGNHIAIFKNAGLVVRKYRYYDRSTNGIDLNGMLDDIQAAPDGSIILLHACAHNPTGCDPTIEEWKQIISVISRCEHVAFFDSAYQGFASGDAEADAQPFRYAVSQLVPILLAQSFAKNFGLYGERCGTLSIVCGDADQKERILSELRLIIRPFYSSPPRHGSSIVKTILNDEQLKAQYYQECASMSRRIQNMRFRLVQALKEVGSQHDWSHVTNQIGMFAFTGMNENMCKELTEKFSIFLTTNGRISIAGLNEGNVDYVARAIHTVSNGKSITANVDASPAKTSGPTEVVVVEPMVSQKDDTDTAEFTVRCHCGRVRGRFRCSTVKVQAFDCNCSDCAMRRNVHCIIPADDFVVDMEEESLEDATILYQWGTQTAVRRFCKTCGCLPWYRPRSNPDGIGITVACVDWTRGGSHEPPKIRTETFDGVHWEDTMKAFNDPSRQVTISSLSKRSD